MKARTAPTLIVLLIFSAWSVGQGQVRRAAPPKPKLDFQLSPHGTLLQLQVDGKPYGDGALREGYAIGYRVGADERFVYAFGDQQAGDLSPAGPQTQSPNSRVATTKDGVWRVTSQFSWDNQSGMVTIVRKLENTSSRGVQLLVVKSQLDDYLAGFEPDALLKKARVTKTPPLPLPIIAWARGHGHECAIGPCPDVGCCSTCPSCTRPPAISAPYSRPGVLFRFANDARAEISSSLVGHSLSLDQLKRPYDVTLYWKARTEFLTREQQPRESVIITVQVPLRR